MAEELIPKHGGYRKLKSFQISQLIYDVTVRFVELYIDRFSRTKDQMVQAARSGVQNIAEGSLASATSKKMELKLTQVARASLEELKLDYEDFLRQRGLPMLEPQHPVLLRFKKRRYHTLRDVQQWVADERQMILDAHGQPLTGKENIDPHVPKSPMKSPTKSPTNIHPDEGLSKTVQSRPCQSLSSSCLAANAALSLLNLACYFLDRQVERLAQDFEREGGFTERLYRVRTAKRNKPSRKAYQPPR